MWMRAPAQRFTLNTLKSSQENSTPVELHDKQKPDLLLYQAKFLMGCSDRGTIRNPTGVQPN